ncbi:hypothetical protein GKZ68_00280 [Hymenobacter sp. BRD128]|uniref:hypothetical protein n=1 Tax=Hymenobacter sp. BRD128 TaxID=2675878 RepID=UPI0015667D2C|nr:hypothetical protein [Hymenobacter sp. BRD128]QKG55208.1 hypothetical protein GKZ68_00280 [Hymenobacter sp. BRD128]
MPAPGAAPSGFAPPPNGLAPARRRVGQGPPATVIRVAAIGSPPAPARPGALPEIPFSRSAIAEVSAFIAAFQGTDYALADLRHYHQMVGTWRDKRTGLPPRRTDWIATAKRFMLNDAADNRLKLAPGYRPATPADTAADPPGVPPAGYRSSRWD